MGGPPQGIDCWLRSLPAGIVRAL